MCLSTKLLGVCERSSLRTAAFLTKWILSPNMIHRYCCYSVALLRGGGLPSTTAAPRLAFLRSSVCPASLRSPLCSLSGEVTRTGPLPTLTTTSTTSAPPCFSLRAHALCSFPCYSFCSHFPLNFRHSTSPLPSSSLAGLPWILTGVRFKMVKSASYRRPPRASPTGQARKPHIGPRRLSAEYVTPGVVLVKQRKVVAFDLETKRRKRHFKMYPGENVGVTSSTHLVALAHGRVKYTHDVSRDVMIVNVLPERKEELLQEDLWRYRTEHVRTVEENRHICFLRMKATRIFPKELVNPPTKPELRPYHFTKRDTWENPTLPDVPIFDDDR